jgi:hypothetical protein
MLAEPFEEDEVELLELDTEPGVELKLEELATLDVATAELATELGATDEGVGVEPLPPPPPPQAISEQLKKGISRRLTIFMVSL